MTRRGLFRLLVAAPVAVLVAKVAPKPAALSFHPKAFEMVMEPLDRPRVGDVVTIDGIPGSFVLRDVSTLISSDKGVDFACVADDGVGRNVRFNFFKTRGCWHRAGWVMRG